MGCRECGALELRAPVPPDEVGRGEGSRHAAATGHDQKDHYPGNGDTTCPEELHLHGQHHGYFYSVACSSLPWKLAPNEVATPTWK